MRCARALPTNQLMPAASSRKTPAATPCWVDAPERMSGRTLFGSPHVGHPIDHHVAGVISVDPDKAGRRHAGRVSRTTFVYGRPHMP
jgi:hypothetical protein